MSSFSTSTSSPTNCDELIKMLIGFERSNLRFATKDSKDGTTYIELQKNLTLILEKVWPYFLNCVDTEFDLRKDGKFNSAIFWDYLYPYRASKNISPVALCALWRDESLRFFTAVFSIALAQAKEDPSFQELFNATHEMYKDSPFRICRAGMDSELDKRLIEGIETGLLYLLWAASAPAIHLLKTDVISRPSIDTSSEKIDCYGDSIYSMISKLTTRSLMTFGIIGNPNDLALIWRGSTVDLDSNWFEQITIHAESLTDEIAPTELQAPRIGCPFHIARETNVLSPNNQNLLTHELESFIRQLAKDTLYPLLKKHLEVNQDKKVLYFHTNNRTSCLLPPKDDLIITSPATVLTGNTSAGKTITVSLLEKEAIIIDEILREIIKNSVEKGFTSQDVIRFVVPIIETAAARHIEKILAIQKNHKKKSFQHPMLPIICDRGIGDYIGMLELVLLSTQPIFLKTILHYLLREDHDIQKSDEGDWRVERKEIKRLIKTLQMWGQKIRYQNVFLLEEVPPYESSSGRTQSKSVRALLRWAIKSSWQRLGVTPHPLDPFLDHPQERANHVLHLAQESFQFSSDAGEPHPSKENSAR